MCGIAGIVGERNEHLIRRMTEVMTHRGPDDDGYYLDDNISLGVRRLAIIDLEGGHQPIFNEDKRLCVILNGEIYNFQELRKDLEGRGHRFATKTDTEVIVHSYEEHGFDCLKYFRGMFAFALWDKEKKLLFIARDRIGIKPLYYTEYNGKLIFASEIKSILEYDGIPRIMDLNSLDLYLTLQYVPAPGTLFKGINKLKQGHYLTCHEGKVRIHRYWDVSFSSEKYPDLEEVKERVDSLLMESVKYHLIADVPVGILLSGGVDSSAMVAYAARASTGRVNTFTVGFGKEGEEYDERFFAEKVAKAFNTIHTEFTIMPEVVSILPKLIYHMDEPIADQAALPVYFLSRTARDYVTVLITGEGGDELFAGYPRYLLNRLYLIVEKLPDKLRSELFSLLKDVRILPDRIRRLLKRFEKNIPDALLRNIRWVSNFNSEEKGKLLRNKISDKNNLDELLNNVRENKKFTSWLDELMHFDLKTWLVDDILMKVDKMSMAVSIEARVPLLDHKLVEFACSLPTQLKLHRLKTKFIFKEVLKNYLPHEILNREKSAFRIPSGEWLKKDWRKLLKYHLLEKTSSIHEYFDSEYIKEITVNHLSGKEDNSQKLWNLLCLDMWHKIYIEGNREFDYSYERITTGIKFSGRQLLIAWDYPPHIGGIQTLLNSIYSPIGSKCVVLAPYTKEYYKFDLLSENEIIRAGFSMNIPPAIGLPFYWGTSFIKALVKIMKNSKIEMIHCGHIRCGITGYFLKLFLKVPYIVWVYALEITDRRFMPLNRFILRNADKIITISHYTKNIIKTFGIDDKKIDIIYPPVSDGFLASISSEIISREYLRNRYALSDKKIILTVARLTELQRYKGIDMVLKALSIVKRRYSDFYYIIWGRGELKEFYLKLAGEYGLGDRVIIDVGVSDDELPLYYSACDLFIMPSREERRPRGILAEGFGIVFLEANACGKPVIGGRSGGIPDAVLDGETGILVDPTNVDEIASAIIKLLTDEELAKEMGRKGRERVLREFTVDSAVKKLMRVIDEVERSE